MGDTIANLPVNKNLGITNQDTSNVFNFFDVDLNNVNLTNDNSGDGGDGKKPLLEIIKFVTLFTILFYICIHPASIARFVENPLHKQLLQTITFAAILFLYLYFNK